MLCHMAHVLAFGPTTQAPQLTFLQEETMRGDRGYRHFFWMHVMLDVHEKREDLLEEGAATMVVDAIPASP